MTQKLSKLKVCQSLLVTLFSVGALSHNAQAEEVSFKGERVEFVMPYKEGGGTDTWGRFYAPYLSQSLPGNPVVVVKNIPGGGSTKGANQFARRAKDNGLNIFASSASTQYPYLLQDRRVRYDYNDWSVILASPTGGVCMFRLKQASRTYKIFSIRKTKSSFNTQAKVRPRLTWYHC